MKSILKNLREGPCRIREWVEEEQAPFSDIAFLQRYFPAMESFGSKGIPKTPFTELASAYFISRWGEEDTTRPNRWTAFRTTTDQTVEPCSVYLKTVHLLNPLDILKGKYTTSCSHPLVPQVSHAWRDTFHKLHHRQNQAYVDTVANYVLSRFRELDLTPHCTLYYGAYTGIKGTYKFNITAEYDTYKNHRWFWKGLKAHRAELAVDPCYEEDRDHPALEEIVTEITTCPFNDLELFHSDDKIVELDNALEAVQLNDSVPSMDATFVDFDAIEVTEEPVKSTKDELHKEQDKEEDKEEEEDDDCDDKYVDEYDDEEDLSDLAPEVDVCMKIPTVPVIVIAQEALEGVMDELLDEEEIDGCERGTQGWEMRWIAWLFQVIAALSFLQGTIGFTHNDLHSNNILWRATKKKYLYYQSRDGKVWRVPTFGKIFCLIDFGRAIFRLGPDRWISDDHWPDQDAGDQYNFGPFYDSSLPKVQPNPSFDLCRLAVSLIDGLFDEAPPKKRGKNVPIMSEEGSWVVHETRSPLYNLLWSWTVDDAGRTVYENAQGDEKYEGFDLYIHIAQDVHRAIPKEQFGRPIFQSFEYSDAVPNGETLYSLKD